MRALSEGTITLFDRNGLNLIINIIANNTWIELLINRIYCGAIYDIPKKSKIYDIYNTVIRNVYVGFKFDSIARSTLFIIGDDLEAILYNRYRDFSLFTIMSTQAIIHKYVLHEKLGKGCFSSVFKGIHKINKKTVAIKIESESAPLNMLKRESKILSYLNKELPIDNRWRVPALFWYGKYGEHICMATTFYPKTLVSHISELWNMNKPNLIIDIAFISYQIIEIFQHVHGAFIIHCDIKPDNFMINESGKIVLIDFGLASLYVESTDTTKHRKDEHKEHLIGSAKYASYFLHNGHTPSRRDDMISIGYLLLVMFKINLPWSSLITSHLKNNDDEPTYEEYHIKHHHNVIRKNMKSPEYLFKYITTANKQMEKKYMLPYLENVYNIGSTDTPDYYTLKGLFTRLY